MSQDEQRPHAQKPSKATRKEIKRHGKLSLEDINWVRSQPRCVKDLWLDCIAAEQFGGGQTRQLETNLARQHFCRAKAVLEEHGLFRFEPIFELTSSGRSKITGWKVENLHGYYNKYYWEFSLYAKVQPSEQKVQPSEQKVQPSELSRTRRRPKRILRKHLIFANQRPTTHQLPTKVVGGVVSVTEKTEAPQEGALPTEDVTLGEGSGFASLNPDLCEGGDPPHTPPPPPPQTDSVALAPPCQGQAPAAFASLTLDTEPPPAQKEDCHEGEGGRMGISLLSTLDAPQEAASLDSLASDIYQAKNAGREQKHLGEDSFSAAAPPAGFHVQIGCNIVLDWPQSLHHQRAGVVQRLDLDAGEVDVRLNGMNYDLTFPLTKVLLVQTKPAVLDSVSEVNVILNVLEQLKAKKLKERWERWEIADG